MSCRAAGAAHAAAVTIAVAADEHARRRVVGVECIDTESHIAWRDFLVRLRSRGLSEARLAASDEHAGLARAVREVMTGAAHQRCVTHLERNVAQRARSGGAGLAAVAALKAAFAETDPSLVRAGCEQAYDLMREHDAPSAGLMGSAAEEVLAYLAFPHEHVRWIRTSNVCERMNREIGRRTNAIQVLLSAESLLRLAGALCCDQSDSWLQEKNSINVRSMVELAPAQPDFDAGDEEFARVRLSVKEVFEKRMKAA